MGSKEPIIIMGGWSYWDTSNDPMGRDTSPIAWRNICTRAANRLRQRGGWRGWCFVWHLMSPFLLPLRPLAKLEHIAPHIHAPGAESVCDRFRLCELNKARDRYVPLCRTRFSPLSYQLCNSLHHRTFRQMARLPTWRYDPAFKYQALRRIGWYPPDSPNCSFKPCQTRA